jgi:CBS domain-containing protein
MPSFVTEVMTYNVVAVRQEAEFKDIVAVMHRRRVSAFPVLDAYDRVIGVVSEADLLPREAYPGGPSSARGERGRVPAKARALTAGELMSSPAITIGPEATVTEAARVMHSRKVKRLPVTDEDGRLVGIVSRVDLLGVYDRPDAQICTEITEQVLAGDFVFDPREFSVAVNNGVVTISGRLERPEVALSLLEAISDVAGVVDVRDRLSYPTAASHRRQRAASKASE